MSMRFVHRILSHRTRSAVPLTDLLDDVASRRLVWFGEFHSEARAVALLNEILVRMSLRPPGSGSGHRRGGGDGRLHVVMEHFNLGMSDELRRFRSDPSFGYDRLLDEYRRVGTEGHDLGPYRGLLDFCRGTALPRGGEEEEEEEATRAGGGGDGPAGGAGADGTPIRGGALSPSPASAAVARADAPSHREARVLGGFVPRPVAARLNKSETSEERRAIFEELSDADWLPPPGSPMRRFLFGGSGDGERSMLNGSAEHRRLIESLMTGRDLYAPVSDQEEEGEEIDQGTPLAKLYQAQLLKDHAMGYFLAKLMLDRAASGDGADDQYLVVTGLGHVKHYLGVPECLMGYIKAESLYSPEEDRRELALGLLCDLLGSNPTGSGGTSSSSSSPCGQMMIGCQMLYETYLEERYGPLAKVEDLPEEEQDDAKRGALNELYLTKREMMDRLLLESEVVRGPLLNPGGGAGRFARPCADYLFVYDEDDENVLPSSAGADERDDGEGGGGDAAKEAAAKAETLDAYNRVGATAKTRGNVAKARAVMLHLGYTERDLEVVGEGDMYNFQGVANPHLVANIQRGERVLDVGSGLGVDSFLAAHACGADTGADSESGSVMVVGIDLAEKEVRHATTRAAERGYHPSRVRFLVGDAERLDEALEGSDLSEFDVCISNGAFCLIPDKRKAFLQVYNALRPGGRMAISTTTVLGNNKLDPDFEWPVCMRMFVNLDELRPICEAIGFKNVQIVDADSPLEGMELPEEAFQEENKEGNGSKRFKIHGKYADHFKHLENMDMDELCKVVTVYGEK